MEQIRDEALEAIVQSSQPGDLAKDSAGVKNGCLVAVQSPTAIVPVRPDKLPKEREEEIGKRAAAILEKVRTDAFDFSIGSFISSLGKGVVTGLNAESSLYDIQMGRVLKEVTVGESPVHKNILLMKQSLDLINPVVVGKTRVKFEEKFMRYFTKTVVRIPRGDEILQLISQRRETINSTVGGIKGHILGNKETVIKHAIELGQICDNLKLQQQPLWEEIYMGQLLWKMLMDYNSTLSGGSVKETVTNTISDLGMAVVDLQTIDNMTLQTRIGGGMTVRNARLVLRLIDRTLIILDGSVRAALGVRAAAAEQVKVVDDLATINDCVADTMIDTAQTVGNAMVRTAESSQKMTVNIEKLAEACAIYEKAADAYAAVCANTVEVAAQSSNALNTMNEKLRARAKAAEASRGE